MPFEGIEGARGTEMVLNKKMTINHRDGSAPGGLHPVELVGELRFCNGPSPQGNVGENDSLMGD